MPTSTRTPSCNRSASSGFTLLELAIVLLILGIAASFVVPRLRTTDDVALQASTARLASIARWLYEEAAFRRLPMRLNVDLDRQVYWVTVFNDDLEQPEFVVDGSPLAQPVALPDAVAFLDVVLPAVGKVQEGVVFAQFSPEGYADALVVHLEGRRGGRATLAVEPLTGRARVAEGYIHVDAVEDERTRSRDQDDEERRG
jgi:general secretion pathway protein H